MCFSRLNPLAVISRFFACIRSYKTITLVISYKTITLVILPRDYKKSTEVHPFSKIILQVKTKSLKNLQTSIPLLLFHKSITLDVRWSYQWQFFSLRICTPPPKKHTRKRTLRKRDVSSIQHSTRKKKSSHRCSSKLQAPINSLEVRAIENPQLRINSSTVYIDTVDAILFSKGDHQMMWILGGEK